MTTLTFPYNPAHPLDLRDESPAEDREGIAVRDISFASPDLDGPGEPRIHAYLVAPPADIAPPYPAILWAHWFEPESESSNRTQFLKEAVELSRAGVVSLLPDCFWTMTPDRWSGPEDYGWATDADYDRALCIKQTVDLRRALDVLLDQPGVDFDRVAYVGHDFGAMFGALLAGVEDRIGQYVLLAGTCAFSDWFVYGSDLTPAEQQTYIADMADLDPVAYIPDAAPADLYFQFARNDFYVPERVAQTFFEAASEPKRLDWYAAAHDMDDAAHTARRDRLAYLRSAFDLS